MNPPFYNPPSSSSEPDLTTKEGRSRRFDERTKELMTPTPERPNGRTFDEALFEMRTGGSADDQSLLELMGEPPPSHFRVEKLKQERTLDRMRRLGEDNAQATKTSPEVSAAMKRNRLSFNIRIDELTGKGFSIDQAILQMRANPTDARLLEAMERGDGRL